VSHRNHIACDHVSLYRGHVGDLTGLYLVFEVEVLDAGAAEQDLRAQSGQMLKVPKARGPANRQFDPVIHTTDDVRAPAFFAEEPQEIGHEHAPECLVPSSEGVASQE